MIVIISFLGEIKKLRE